MKISYLIFILLIFGTNILKAKNVNYLPLCKITNGKIETLTECYGELEYKNGTSYKGEFYKKKKWGLGLFTALNGQYIGNFTNNKFDGVGVYEFNSNLLHSRFCYENWLARENENQYVDIFPSDSNDETCFFKTKYVGNFRNQRIEGEGVFFFPNQQYLSGKWGCSDWTRCILERQYYLHDIISGKIEKDFFKIKNNQNEINQIVKNNKKTNEQKNINQFNKKDKKKNERKRKTNIRKRNVNQNSQNNNNNQKNNNKNQSREKSFDQKFGKSNDTFTSQGFGNWSDKWISGN